MTDSKMTTPKRLAEPRDMPAQSGSSAFAAGCTSFSLFSYKSLFAYIKKKNFKKCSKEKHQFLKYPMNAFTLSGKIALSPLKDDIWSKKCIYTIRKGPERLLITEMTELHNITVESRKKHVYALYLLAGTDPSELWGNKDAIL